MRFKSLGLSISVLALVLGANGQDVRGGENQSGYRARYFWVYNAELGQQVTEPWVWGPAGWTPAVWTNRGWMPREAVSGQNPQKEPSEPGTSSAPTQPEKADSSPAPCEPTKPASPADEPKPIEDLPDKAELSTTEATRDTVDIESQWQDLPAIQTVVAQSHIEPAQSGELPAWTYLLMPIAATGFWMCIRAAVRAVTERKFTT
jgi:hypothetical protein